MPNSLGKELSAALTNITALIIQTESKSERIKLTQQQAKMAGLLQVLVDKVVDESLKEYEAATLALNQANAEACAAKEKLDRVAATINKIAVAIDKVANLAAKISVG